MNENTLEHGIRLYLAPAKGRFVRSNVVDLVVVIIAFLRPLRIMRSARMESEDVELFEYSLLAVPAGVVLAIVAAIRSEAAGRSWWPHSGG